MRSHRKLNDGRVLEFNGTNRYAAFRLTLQGGYSFTSSKKAADVVRRAQETHHLRGYKTMAIDTQTGECLAAYPPDLMDLAKEQSA